MTRSNVVRQIVAGFVFCIWSVWLGGAFAQNVCASEAGRGDQAVREQYQQSIDYFLRLAAAARAKGFDPRRFPQADQFGNVQSIDLIQVAVDLTAQRDQGINAIFARFQECRAGVAPYQAIVDTTVFFLTGGMSQVVPNRALHIDASNLLAGTPFGGPNALVPQARDQILNALGIGGPAAEMIRNPLQIGQNGPIRLPWTPAIGNLPPLPNIPLPKTSPLEIGKVGGHRICIPWC